MDSTLKQRLIGAAVLAALAIIFLPMLLKGPDVKEPDAAEVPLSMPAAPGQEFETRELPLTTPDTAAPPGGVLGLAPAPTAAVPAATVDSGTPPTAAGDSTLPAVVGPPAAVGPAVAVPTPTPPLVTPLKPVTAPVAVPAEKLTGTAATSGAGKYAVNIGSFSNLASANSLVVKLRAADLPVSADKVTLSSGAALRIRVGPYTDRAAAEAARLRAEAVSGGSSKVIALDAEPAPAAPAATKAATAATPIPAKVAAVAAPVPAAAGKPAPVTSGFAVQLSAPSVEADAIALRDKARGQGFSSFVQRIETDAGVRFRVRVGPVADRVAAETMRDAVNAKLGTKGIVVANP
jgi:cell division septation protein DedD